MLPFHVTNFFGTNVQLTGVAIPKQDGLHICVHKGDVPTSLFDAKTKTWVIPWANIKELNVKESMFGDSLTIRVNSTIDGLPGAKSDLAKLVVHKRDRQRHDSFRREVEECRSGKPDQNVEGMIDDVRDFLTDL